MFLILFTMLKKLKNWVAHWPIWTRFGNWFKEKLDRRGYKFNSTGFSTVMLWMALTAEGLYLLFGLGKEANKVSRVMAAIYTYGQYFLLTVLHILYWVLGHIRPKEDVEGEPNQLEKTLQKKAILTLRLAVRRRKIRKLEREKRKMQKDIRRMEKEIINLKKKDESTEQEDEKEMLLKNYSPS